MKLLNRERDVIQIASELKVDTTQPVSAITRFCSAKIDRWLREGNVDAGSLREIQSIVCAKLQLVFHEVWSDRELDQLIEAYIAKREFVFAALRDDFDEHTFATLLERRNVSGSAPDRYVAVIDCREPAKAARRYFTRWHEIAHLMTLTRQLQLPFHRSSTERTPTERLMDAIAGEIGFYDPIVRPALRAQLATDGRLTFAGVERVREAICADASYRATLNACVSRAPKPVLLVEAGMGYKNAERAALESRQLMLLPSAPPTPQLRVLSTVSNDAARKMGLRLDRNMRVPAKSFVARHFTATDRKHPETAFSGEEHLGIWRHSDGSAAGSGMVSVETRFVADHVLALMQRTVRSAAPPVAH